MEKHQPATSHRESADVQQSFGPAALAALLASPHVGYVTRCRETFSREFFPLTAEEIRELERNGNTAEHWGLVRKTTQGHLQTARVRQCAFHGKVVLGRFSGAVAAAHELDGVPFAPGVYNSALRNVVVLDDALVKDTTVLCNVLVDVSACVVQCGSVTCAAPGTAFGNGQVLHVGVETGGRDLRVVADMPFALGATIATKRGDPQLLETFDAFMDEYVDQMRCLMTIVGPNARVRNCSRVEATFVGDYAVLEDCDVTNSTVLSTAQERSTIRTKSVVRDSIVQWNSTVEILSVVEGAFLCDTSHVERHGMVISSVVGPNTSVAEGEVTSSFVGPFVGFHHQALLIASVWPQGKGNIGYGANVGSNHTLKAPDQELFHGEGVFFGLGCNVKFPSNFVRAPYSVIATAVNTLPQLVAMPFALINTPGHTIPSLSPAINEISPGWVLSSSVFTVLRNEQKFRSRNKSKHARAELEKAEGQAQLHLESGEAVYTSKEVPGIGKNYMRESSRKAGITAYTFFIKLYALDALLVRVESGGVSVNGTVGSVDHSVYELATLLEELAPEKTIRECLCELVTMRMAVAKKAADGKSRDDARGKRIIPDYGDVHKPATEEEVVLQAQRNAEKVKQRVSTFVARV